MLVGIFLLNKCYRLISNAYLKAVARDAVSGAQEWLLDNFYIIEEQTKHVRQEVMRKRSFEIARKMVRENDGIITREIILQSITEDDRLLDAEIWALPAMLKFALIERISEIVTAKASEATSEIEAKKAVSMGHAITSLKAVSSLNMVQIFMLLSGVERILMNDPSGIYPQMTEESKNYYRMQVERIAKKRDMTTFDVAEKVVELAGGFEKKHRKAHVGYYLLTTELGKTRGNIKGFKRWAYTFGAMLACSAIIAWGGLNWGGWFALLIAVPASDIVLNIANYITTKCAKPSFIPRLDFSERGVPKELASYIVIPSMVTSGKGGSELLEDLETYYLANRHDNLRFMLICDFAEKASNRQGIKDELDKKVQELNDKYGMEKFGVFAREVSWERKRGALLEFARSVRGTAKYILTLDSDTRAGRGVVAELIGAMAHPLNQPKVSKQKGRVVSGYGIMQPRVTTSVESANKSLFSKVFAGQGGIDSYSNAISDIYQDLFDEGIFTGKGIFDIDTFLEVLPDAICENTVLSHDLLEGSFLRCALISDITLVDSFPFKYNSYMSRLHRWIRGDWQLLPFLSRKCKLNGVSKWKMIDNMRRSLVPIALSSMLLYSFKTLPIVILTLCAQLLISTIEWAIHRRARTSGQRLHSTIIFGLKGVIYQSGFLLITLPHSAYISLDAVVRTVWRVCVSHKKMLEWTTAADSERRAKGGLAAEYSRMISSVVYGAAIMVLAHGMDIGAEILGLVWILAPMITHRVSREIPRMRPNVTLEDEHMLRQLARRTWQYYEDFSGELTNYLAPDNYQENPPNGVAMRTSPTNIGMQLMAALTAYDFGFVTRAKMIDILERTMNSVEKLEKWNGNLYNWYNLENLEPLRPKYVSSVDSGNFLGYVITAAQGLRDCLQEIAERRELERRGLWDVLKLAGLEQGADEADLNDIERLLEENYTVWRKAAIGQLADFRAERDLIDEEKRLQKLILRLDILADSTSLAPLYDDNLELFSIGYNAEQQELTKSYYDLLASEARQTSFIAVARGEVPTRHWARLGRALVSRDGYRGLISWTGSAFEYLMPLLIMGNVPNTLLDETYHFAIRAQKKYARLRGVRGVRTREVIWGTSESGFNAFDIDLNYQYKAFGVPDLGVSRGILSDVVIAPYASTLSLMVDFRGAMENLKVMNEEGFCGTYGLYEAVDFTPKRVLPNQKYSIVKSFMVHHLGMSLLAINNVLNDNILQKRFGKVPFMRSAEELLSERVPINVIISKENRQRITPMEQVVSNSQSLARDNVQEGMHVLSNGKFTALLDHNGNGFCKKGDVLLNHKDIGDYVYIKNVKTGKIFSATGAPCLDSESKYNVSFLPDRAEFVRNGDDGIDVLTQVFVCAEEHALMRTMLIANNSGEDIELEIVAYSEIVLASESSHYAHMTFSKLFVRSEIRDSAIVFARRPREDKEKEKVALAACKVFVDGAEVNAEIETARCNFLERKGSYANPRGVVAREAWKCDSGAVLDPIAAFRFKIKILKDNSARLISILGFCANREDARILLEKYGTIEKMAQAQEICASRSQIEDKFLDVERDTQNMAMELLPKIIFGRGDRSAQMEEIKKNTLGQAGLWAFGISGDASILVHVVENDDMGHVKKLLGVHKFLAFKGINVDLILISIAEADYLQPIATAVRDIVQKENAGGNVHVLAGSALSEAEKNLLLASGWRV
ncbi:hypothetical protein FACS189425_01340 [Clostridia bacterium]|nr:hypothetical protein FACS189425_01340 [Clostridia bacterium]